MTTRIATSRTALSTCLALGACALLPLAACTTRQAAPAPTQAGVLEDPAPEMPPETGDTGDLAELSPAGTQRPARIRGVQAPGDIPPPSPPAPVFTTPPPPPPPGLSQAAPPTAPGEDAGGLREVFPSVRIDPAAKVVEFDGAVAWDVHDPQTPMTFLELIVCTPDTKEYESLVVSRARPSNVHAALLLLGIEPGKPGSFTWKDERVAPVDPEGPPLEVSFVLEAGTPQERVIDPLSWVVNAADATTFRAHHAAASPQPGWKFAGSRIVRRDVGQGEQDFYLADGDDGSLVGLTTFGSETIAWGKTISPDASVSEPEWIANVAAMPKLGTPVTVRLRPLAAAAPSAPAPPQP